MRGSRGKVWTDFTYLTDSDAVESTVEAIGAAQMKKTRPRTSRRPVGEGDAKSAIEYLFWDKKDYSLNTPRRLLCGNPSVCVDTHPPSRLRIAGRHPSPIRTRPGPCVDASREGRGHTPRDRKKVPEAAFPAIAPPGDVREYPPSR